jgi:hypothetical protein
MGKGVVHMEVCMPRSVALRFKILRRVEPAWMVMGRMAGNTGGLSFTSLNMKMDFDIKKNRCNGLKAQGADPPPSSTRKTHLMNEEITPLLPTATGERCCQNHIKFRTCSALAPM